ncbi:MAG: alpha/beta hydrolase, partial [Gemmatimonadetes bacterium]|nr:alpha/beta hydrolase [Gemmatimonadota bacterium]NIT87182.1 alpha/beta hydrolase [Gemmatimonadota bacterium]NIU77193.1 alpha/beta hydrolase [Gammaproteobacteria bacterium]NIY10619.1 alpha/beta hydrolase [Gemmatimonadota bacterium]NIY39379.1 alpha/beta hydrolase [Gemmatimonadota bacterium]
RREFLRWLRLTRGLPERLRAFESRDPGVPTLYVMGDQDHMFLPGALAAAGAQASAEIHVIEDCGHVCTFERAEEFNRVSMEFLRRS